MMAKSLRERLAFRIIECHLLRIDQKRQLILLLEHRVLAMFHTKALQIATNYAILFTLRHPATERFVCSSDLRHVKGHFLALFHGLPQYAALNGCSESSLT